MAPSRLRWNSTLANAKADTSNATGTLRRLPPATISRQISPASTIGNAMSMTAAGHGATEENIMMMRPASHSANSAASGAPESGSRPVQLGTAVSRNPAMAAGR